ncbi:RloB family protein [Pedobacter aquatilis]|uniref:RloB family protein n=1 Tax=Pedobacter aquatilis TaxID=351343 RepID=UPI0029319126|nr:RloB family protein [Pedobacter aquatilis]
MEPWEIKSDDSREANSKKLFIIFCEDGAVEPAYFELFQRDDLQISAFGNTKQHHAQVDYATEYFRKNDLIEIDENGKEILKIDEGAQVWCVFDRDREPNDQKDTAFNDSIATANNKGIKTAWSNDDFELWVLLHFEDVNPEDAGYLNRQKYYERLTTILKERLPEENMFKNPQFDYYSAMKSKNRFLRYTYQLMKENIDQAIERAEKLEGFHSSTPKPLHLHCPCTKVHHLVKELLS